MVLSGDREAVELAVRLGKARRHVRRVVPLSVSAPFHCEVMRPAAQALEEVRGEGVV